MRHFELFVCKIRLCDDPSYEDESSKTHLQLTLMMMNI